MIGLLIESRSSSHTSFPLLELPDRLLECQISLPVGIQNTFGAALVPDCDRGRLVLQEKHAGIHFVDHLLPVDSLSRHGELSPSLIFGVSGLPIRSVHELDPDCS